MSDTARLPVGTLPLGTGAGGLVLAGPHEHVLFSGSTGSGKTSRGIAPALLRSTDSHAVVLSSKTDTINATYRARSMHGTVYVLDPRNATGGRVSSTTLDVCAWGAASYDAAREAVAVFKNSAPSDGLHDSAFWLRLGAKRITPYWWVAAVSGYSLRRVHEWLTDESTDWEFQLALEAARTRFPADGAAAEADYRRCVEAEHRTKSSIELTSDVILDMLGSPAVLGSLSEPGFTVEEFAAGPGANTLYLSLPDAHRDGLGAAFTTLLMRVVHHWQNLEAAGTPASRPLLLVIDEAARSLLVQDLPDLLSRVRSAGVRIVSAWQDLAQAEAAYGTHSLYSLLTNTAWVLQFGGARDPVTVDRLEFRLAGREVPGLDAPVGQRLRQLPAGKALVVGHTHAELVSAPGYWQDPSLRSLPTLWLPLPAYLADTGP